MLIKKVESERQNGINSTLFVRMTNLIINNGEANIEMREAQLKHPTNIRRIELSVIFKLPTQTDQTVQ